MNTQNDIVQSKPKALINRLRETLRARWNSISEQRKLNSTRHALTNNILMILFPLFIVFIAEINQMKYPSKFIIFLLERPGVLAFDVLITAILFMMLLSIFKKGWPPVLIVTVLYLTLSITELFKYGANGNHLILTDVKLAGNLKNMGSFDYVRITPQLIIYVALALSFVLLVFMLNPVTKANPVKRICSGTATLTFCVMLIAVPSFSSTVYSVFDVDNSNSYNVFKINEKFESNNLVAFLFQTTSESLANRVREPETYTEDTIDQILEESDDEATVSSDKPNVICIMSEAFADFRTIDPSLKDSTAYEVFDKICDESVVSGVSVVPTLGSYTVRTEFELLFGLPVKSLNDPTMPQRMLLNREQATVPRYYSSLGYETFYIHSFLRDFYSRSTVYSNFGFDEMYYQDNLTVDVTYRNAYINDSVVFNQALECLEKTNDPAYIHITTMENHQPYNYGEDPTDELSNYLAGVENMLDELQAFLDSIDEPTVVILTGDHYPSFRGEGNIYDKLGISSANCSSVYLQRYFIWSNCEEGVLDTSVVPDEPFSTFYMPYIVMQMLDLPLDEFGTTMADKLNTLPIYSTQYDPEIPNDTALDTLTYDRILGDALSYDGVLAEIEPDESDE